MSAGRKFVISTVLIIAAVAAGAVLGSRFLLQRSPEKETEQMLIRRVEKNRPDTVRESYSFEHFSGIIVQGAWNITIEKGKGNSIEIEIPRGAKEELSVRLESDTLVLEIDKWMTALTVGTMNARVTTSMLERIKAEGGSKILFSGFDGKVLDLTIEGASHVVGDGNRYEKLTIDADGAINIDLRSSVADNVRVDLSGAGKVELALTDGGTLDGSVEGLGKISYSGENIDVSVDSERGLSNITHVNQF